MSLIRQVEGNHCSPKRKKKQIPVHLMFAREHTGNAQHYLGKRFYGLMKPRKGFLKVLEEDFLLGRMLTAMYDEKQEQLNHHLTRY